jgi:hypothetical protein
MTFDQEGHVVVTPAELESKLRGDMDRLICEVLLPGTPAAFATYHEYCRFREMLAEQLSVHPSSIIFRGSTKIGFSLTPRAEKAWVAMGPDSDICTSTQSTRPRGVVPGQFLFPFGEVAPEQVLLLLQIYGPAGHGARAEISGGDG